ncbi:MAG: hypothetical protein GC159_06735 [Phycisphaera sp.]|nr:hypothetical protein [Phycisphaera sp.]
MSNDRNTGTGWWASLSWPHAMMFAWVAFNLAIGPLVMLPLLRDLMSATPHDARGLPMDLALGWASVFLGVLIVLVMAERVRELLQAPKRPRLRRRRRRK